jgi:hypothetical protein
MRFGRFTKIFAMSAAVLCAVVAPGLACPMCTTNLANAENAAEAETINTAILFLLGPTLALIAWMIRLAFRYRHYQNDESRPDVGRAVDAPEGNPDRHPLYPGAVRRQL